MHRVELKDGGLLSPVLSVLRFLMHRVELKVAVSYEVFFHVDKKVPNAPCGVERQGSGARPVQALRFLMHRVELKDARVLLSRCLAPARMFLMHRVELKVKNQYGLKPKDAMFLMHRVELKVPLSRKIARMRTNVPNAPCGVERQNCRLASVFRQRFLMHRVELKVGKLFHKLLKLLRS